MRVPDRPSLYGSEPDSDQLHAKANNDRLEHIMTLLECLIDTLNTIEMKMPSGPMNGGVGGAGVVWP